MEALISILAIIVILSTIHFYKSSIKKLNKRNALLYNENCIVNEKNIQLQYKHDELLKLSSKIADLNTNIIAKWGSTTNIKDFVISLLNNLKRIEMAILNSKNKRTKEHKELLLNKSLLFTFISNVLLQFDSEIYNIDLLNNYKMLGYKNIIFFDFENYVFSEDKEGNLVCEIISPLTKEKIEQLQKENPEMYDDKKEDNCLELLKEDVEIVVKKLVNPPLPNERLKSAQKRYNNLVTENNSKVLREDGLYH